MVAHVVPSTALSRDKRIKRGEKPNWTLPSIINATFDLDRGGDSVPRGGILRGTVPRGRVLRGTVPRDRILRGGLIFLLHFLHFSLFFVKR